MKFVTKLLAASAAVLGCELVAQSLALAQNTATPATTVAAPVVAAPAAPESASAKPTPGKQPKAAASRSAAATKSGGKAMDRIELDPTKISGNRELPKVLFIVPWKRSDLGDLVGRPVNSLLDEVLSPVDRDVFKRQNRYYDALNPDGSTRLSPAPDTNPDSAPRTPVPANGPPIPEQAPEQK